MSAKEISINQVQISGYVTNVFLRKTSSGKDVANFSVKLANFDKQGNEHAQYINCTSWNAQAVRVSELPKGARVRISGKLSTASWTDKATGDKRVRIEIVCDELEAVGHLQSPIDHAAKTARPISDEDLPF